MVEYPEALIVAVGVAVLLIAVAIGWALDVFLGWAEAPEPEHRLRAANSMPLTDVERDELMAAHRRVVARHAADLRVSHLREVSRR